MDATIPLDSTLDMDLGADDADLNALPLEDQGRPECNTDGLIPVAETLSEFTASPYRAVSPKGW